MSGIIYAFIDPNDNVGEASFFLDNQAKAFRVEKVAPFDIGGGSVAEALPYNTKAISDGTHTITADLILKTGGAATIGVTFTVQNRPIMSPQMPPIMRPNTPVPASPPNAGTSAITHHWSFHRRDENI